MKRFSWTCYGRHALMIAVLVLATGQSASAQVIPKAVRVVYLTPSDKTYRADYEANLANAITNLQTWYGGQMGDSTFATHASDSVEWYQTSHPASYYQTNPAGPSYYNGRFWESVLGDAFALTGGRFNDPNNRWLFYIDADPLAGQYIGGTSGVALLAANDLRGLNGDPTVAINPGDPTINPGVNRWIGGAGHELGHAFGLAHPPTSPGGPDDNALMYLGYTTYPNTYLRASDKANLRASGFFLVAVPEANSVLLLASGVLLPLCGAVTRYRRRKAA